MDIINRLFRMTSPDRPVFWAILVTEISICLMMLS